MRSSLFLLIFVGACIGPPPDAIPHERDGGSRDTSDAAADGDVAAAIRCDDGTRNGDETDVDCGGSSCDRCAVGQGCERNSDCDAGVCQDGSCRLAASCRQLHEEGLGTGDGDYRIDPDGDGPLEEITVRCDMTSDGGVGYTMYRLEDDSLSDDQNAYRTACEEIGLELIVPRSRDHAEAIVEFNGGTPNLIGVYPRAGAAELDGLDNWTGRCGGEPCRFYVSDEIDNDAQCGGGYEPSGDAGPNDALIGFESPTDECPLGQFNDQQNTVYEQGYVLCSTNDAGPPVHGSCLELLQANSVQNTRLYGTHGMYEVQPDGAPEPINVYCDFTRDGGGYGYLKLEETAGVTTQQAEDRCAQHGMHLLVPRTPVHLRNAYFVGLDTNIAATGGEDFLRLLGVYPEADGAGCASTPMTSTNEACEMRASDDGPFFVHDRNDIEEPDGSDSLSDESPIYTWNRIEDQVEVATISEAGPGEATAQRFLCVVGDKTGPPD
jgi:hypothetical protein